MIKRREKRSKVILSLSNPMNGTKSQTDEKERRFSERSRRLILHCSSQPLSSVRISNRMMRGGGGCGQIGWTQRTKDDRRRRRRRWQKSGTECHCTGMGGQVHCHRGGERKGKRPTRCGAVFITTKVENQEKGNQAPATFTAPESPDSTEF